MIGSHSLKRVQDENRRMADKQWCPAVGRVNSPKQGNKKDAVNDSYLSLVMKPTSCLPLEINI